MRVTTRHEASRFGVPVILDDAGQLMPHPDGLLAVLARLGWDRGRFAAAAGVSRRTVEAWCQGRWPVPAAPLNVLRDALDDQRATGRPPTAGA